MLEAVMTVKSYEIRREQLLMFADLAPMLSLRRPTHPDLRSCVAAPDQWRSFTLVPWRLKSLRRLHHSSVSG